jgi:hypothetical protein
MSVKKLEELFQLPEFIQNTDDNLPSVIEQYDIKELDAVIDRIDNALPTVRNMNTDDRELDELANKAVETFDNLVDLAMNVDSRYAGEIFSVASSMYGHALTAKQAKINKKLKTVELQLKKARLDLEQSKLSAQSEETVETAEGQVLTRNDLLARVLNPESGNATSV